MARDEGRRADDLSAELEQAERTSLDNAAIHGTVTGNLLAELTHRAEQAERERDFLEKCLAEPETAMLARLAAVPALVEAAIAVLDYEHFPKRSDLSRLREALAAYEQAQEQQ